jgi:hypothetical protein
MKFHALGLSIGSTADQHILSAACIQAPEIKSKDVKEPLPLLLSPPVLKVLHADLTPQTLPNLALKATATTDIEIRRKVKGLARLPSELFGEGALQEVSWRKSSCGGGGGLLHVTNGRWRSRRHAHRRASFRRGHGGRRPAIPT